MDENLRSRKVDQFVLDEIDSVPHLEALLLLWKNHPRSWAADELARALYLRTDSTQTLLHDLENRGLVILQAEGWTFNVQSAKAELMESVDTVYRRELVRISGMIHSKASPAVRQFARAFRLKKD